MQKGEAEPEFVSASNIPPLPGVKELVLGCLILGQEEPGHPNRCNHILQPMSILSELLCEERDPQSWTVCGRQWGKEMRQWASSDLCLLSSVLATVQHLSVQVSSSACCRAKLANPLLFPDREMAFRGRTAFPEDLAS